MKSKILIFGISGFTGKHLVRYLVRNNLLNDYYVKGYDINESPENYPVETQILDLTLKNELEEIIISEKPDYIINLACSTNNNDFESLIKINVNLPKNIIDIIISKKIILKKLLLIGSAAEYGSNINLPLTEESELCPVNLYGLSKVYQSKLAEYYFRLHSININVARTFNIFSDDLPANLSIGSFIKQINDLEDGGTLNVGNLNSKRDFLQIENIIDAYWKILITGKNGQVYNVCSGKSILIKDILDWLISKSGKKININCETSRYKEFDIIDSYGDNKKLLNQLSWKLFSLDFGKS